MSRYLWLAALVVTMVGAMSVGTASAQYGGWGKPDVAPIESGSQLTSYIESGEKLYLMKWSMTNNDDTLTWKMTGE
ncbi:hypothetical protein KDL45_16420, partial [bacterium]|nr:hypothetical protein [bacterium]